MAEAVAEMSTAGTSLQRAELTGWAAALGSAAAFGTSGPFAKALLASGWSAGAVVAVRLGLAAAVLMVPAAIVLRGRWGVLAGKWRSLLLYGVFGGATAQVGFFNAVRYLDVAIGLLLEYLGILLVVGWVWLRTARRPSWLTLAGIVTALGGLVVVLNPGSLGVLDPRGIAWGAVAALGLAVYFVVSAETAGVPPVAFVAVGLAIGAVATVLAGLAGLMPLQASTADIAFVGLVLPWWMPLLELVVVAAAAAYLLGFVGARQLGPTVASFVGLTEVLFAVGWAWLLLRELPGPAQLAGGLVLLVGVAAVQAGQASRRSPGPDRDGPAGRAHAARSGRAA